MSDKIQVRITVDYQLLLSSRDRYSLGAHRQRRLVWALLRPLVHSAAVTEKVSDYADN